MRKFISAVCVGLSLTGWVAARADVSMGSVFGDHMVLQRERSVPVWGWAAPGESVTVGFGGQKVSGKADAKGKWRVDLAAMPANATPQEMTVTGANTITLKDVLVGEVWLCSGQSNMGLPVRSCLNAEAEIAAAKYPGIRAFTVFATSSTNQGYVINPDASSQCYALTPQDKCNGVWQVCTPDATRNWSAVGYYFARELYQKLHVPVGIVVAAYGATAIEGWMSVDGLKAVPAYRQRADAFEFVSKAWRANTNDFAQALAAWETEYHQRCQAWFAQLDAEDPGLKMKWMEPALDVSQWGTITLPVTVADNPIGAPVASIWFRKEVTIPQDWVGKDLELHLGLVDSVDEAYINGVRVGRTWFDTDQYWMISRVYAVPAAAVSSTKISVSLRLLKTIYHMGLFGPAAEMKVVLKGGTDAAPVSLAGEWRMRKAQGLDAGRQPQLAPLLGKRPGNHYGHPGAQYNGQIHPLVPYAIRGAIWYQGEANAPFYIDYRSLMPGLITSWRKEWGQGDFPFGIIALADYGGQQTTAVERGGYHNVREAQAMTADTLTNTFLATVVGVGEGADIHPKRKQEVSRRLAMGALNMAYGQKDVVPAGPTYKSMAVEGNTIRLRFDYAKGLHAQGDPPVGFAIAGENRAFYFAHAKIDGDTVVVWADKVPKPVAVRYAWAGNPVCNVYNSDNLPMFQFHTDNWDISQLVIPTDDAIIIPSGWVPK